MKPISKNGETKYIIGRAFKFGFSNYLKVPGDHAILIANSKV